MGRISNTILIVLLCLMGDAFGEQYGRQAGGKTCPNNLFCG